MKSVFYTLIFLSLSILGTAQEQVTVGPNYSQQTFYSLANSESTSVDIGSWDIAFTTHPGQNAGIFINEAVPLDMTGMATEVALYLAASNDFTQNSEIPDSTWTRLYNPELDWNVGAFNMNADPSNFLDFGWGVYDPASMTVVGTTVYIVALRNGTYKKLKVNSLSMAYEFVYADLDGANENTITINRADHAGKVLAYFSLENDQVVDVEPTGWDLVFNRYGTFADNGAGVFLDNYVVTGVLAGLGVEVAQADAIDPTTVEAAAYVNDYDSQIDVVGHDWKNFDLTQFQWIIKDDLAYFVKTADEQVCKLFFIDFEGSATGVITMEKECSTLSSTDDEIELGVGSFDVFPNPSNGAVSIVLDLAKATKTEVQIYNMMGQKVQSQTMDFAAGFSARNFNIDVAPGRYQLVIAIGGEQIVRPVIIAN